MVEVMNYSAGMVSQVFTFVEMKQTAELIVEGMPKDEIRDDGLIVGELFLITANAIQLIHQLT